MSKPRDDRQKDLLHPPLDEIIDLGHPLARWLKNPCCRVPRTLMETLAVRCRRWGRGLSEPACRGRLQTT
jgi:hypothetical protein